jgi:hypothetical protein
MTKPKASLKSSLRKSVIGAYRSRGKGKNNLWLVSSIKTKQDWILPSDRQLVHWIYYLETNQKVTDFNLAPEPILSYDDNEVRATELDAIVTLNNKHQEWHEVKAGKGKSDDSNKSQFLAQAAAASKNQVSYHRFDDNELKSKVKVAMRWLKPISYANVVKDEGNNHCRTELVLNLKNLKAGNVKQVLDLMAMHDSALVIGFIAKLAIEGIIALDLNVRTFGLLTPWKYYD